MTDTIDTARPAATAVGASCLLEVAQVRQAFEKPDGKQLLVLDDVTLHLADREIVALLGRSGSGKSTLLRIIAGLTPRSGGSVLYAGRPVDRPCPQMAMVFQTFALFPWLTVLENVEIGLEAQGVDREARRRRALRAIDLIGLDGFENAYPKELSGGMRQRVGFARALVVDPELLLMDEPFSALDVLTAETLRTDLLELWTERRIPMKAMLIVTHNIEEAVLMADRILIFSSNPGQVAAELAVRLPHPRDRHAPEFRQMVDDIYARMTARSGVPAARSIHTLGHRLPSDVGSNLIAGLLEALAAAPYGGRAELPDLGRALQMEADELFPIIESLEILGFAEAVDGDLILAPSGRQFVDGDLDQRKVLFWNQLRTRVPLADHIRRVLEERPGHGAPYVRFATELEDHLSEDEAAAVLDTVIRWGRFAELFSYDDDTAQFGLEDAA